MDLSNQASGEAREAFGHPFRCRYKNRGGAVDLREDRDFGFMVIACRKYRCLMDSWKYGSGQLWMLKVES